LAGYYAGKFAGYASVFSLQVFPKSLAMIIIHMCPNVHDTSAFPDTYTPNDKCN